jgi:hypothetical protein
VYVAAATLLQTMQITVKTTTLVVALLFGVTTLSLAEQPEPTEFWSFDTDAEGSIQGTLSRL